MDQVGRHGGEIVREPERSGLAVPVRVEELGVLVAGCQPLSQAHPQRVEVRIRTDVRLGIARRNDILARAKLGSGQHHLRDLQQEQRNNLLGTLAAPERGQSVEEVTGVPGNLVGEQPPVAVGLSGWERHASLGRLRWHC